MLNSYLANAVLARETDQGLMLLDGHLRAEVAPDEMLPVLVLDVTPEEGDKLLASLDPLGAMAAADAEKLNALLADLETNSEAVQALFDSLAEKSAMFDVAEADFPELASGERDTLATMNFTLTTDQVETVKQAIKAAKDQGPFVDTGNANSNGDVTGETFSQDGSGTPVTVASRALTYDHVGNLTGIASTAPSTADGTGDLFSKAAGLVGQLAVIERPGAPNDN